jgi:N-acetylglutamate synthase-like GNAT family acetyltransferase
MPLFGYAPNLGRQHENPLVFLMNIRPARAADQPTIERIIHEAGINPMSLDWRRFVIAEDGGEIVGIGQIKVHSDGSRELASLAVIPERRGQGIGSEIIRTLLARENGVLYLTCREQLETYYTRFGFRKIAHDEMPQYFRRIIRLAHVFMALSRSGVKIIVMKREP